MKITRRNIEILVLIIYTVLNFRVLYPFLFGEGSQGFLLTIGVRTSGITLLAIFVALFLNVALIIYWVKKDGEVK